MKILLLAPQPFYRERGTPIAVDLLLRALAAHRHQVDVLAYHLGADVAYPGVTLRRIPRLPGIRDVPPGFSLRKLICDGWLLAKALRLAARGHYQAVHAVEESVFMAMLIKRLYGIPYIFDMDSSMPDQLGEKHPGFRRIAARLDRCEAAAVRGALAVVAVCDALAERARRCGARRVFLLRDISLLDPAARGAHDAARDPLRRQFDVAGFCFLYVGNLEHYQGIDLLLEGFAHLRRQTPEADATLAIAGGTAAHIAHYQARAQQLGIADRTRFIGRHPIARMGELFQMADALVSPRIAGNNTPMKVYSYLDSGRPVLATDLPTHTQALSHQTACLVAPTPAALADGMRQLLANPACRRQLADQARQLVDARYSRQVFQETVGQLYQWVAETVTAPEAPP